MNKKIYHACQILILPYWKSEDKYFAGILLSLVIALNVGYVYLNVKMNQLSGAFYDSLQKLSISDFKTNIFKFLLCAMIFIITFLTKEYIQDFLSFQWRSWMTRKYVERWLTNKAFYHSLQIENNLDNPDQRISEDISSFTAGILSLGTAFLSSIINFISFSFILWSLSPKQPIPGYMLWLTLLYCGIATFTIFKIGKPLVKLDFYKEKKESDFRYNLMRIIERKDEIALLNGEQDEIKKINQKFYAIKENYLKILFRNLYISTAQNIFGNAVNVFPLIAAAPSFFSGAITLGVLMQISNAFSQVQDSLMLFASNYQGIASISATANRLTQFYESTEIKNDKPSALTIIIDNTCLETHRLCLYKPNMNTPLVKINFSLQPREKLIIKGESGIGKTTLIKTLAGIWPYATGEIKRPTTIEIMPQKPYFPVGTLKEAILYGNNVAISDDEILGLLSKLNLSTLYQDLNTHADWNAKLSLGEQQRLSIVRIILKKPQWLILDEPTASLDTENQKNAIYTLFKALPEAAILTISHSDLLIEFHDRVLSIGQKNSNAVMNYSLV